MIKEMIGTVGGALIMTLATYYTMYKLLEEKLKFNLKTDLILILHTAIMMSLYFLTDGLIRIILLYMILVIFGNFLFNHSFIKIILTAFMTYILIFLSEALFSFFIVILMKIDISSFKDSYAITCISNICIALIIYLFIKIKYVIRFLHSFIGNISSSNSGKVISIILLSLSTLNLLVYYLYFDLNSVSTILLNIILISVYIGLTITLFKENSEKAQIKSKYDNVVNTSEKYETVIEQLRMSNHENKNNLIVLKGMIKNENKEVKEYIDDLINDERKQDNNLLIRTNSIPTGGLQGLIYQKLLDMKEKNIYYYLEVNKNIDKKKIEKIDMVTNKDLCTIVGVFLDNAIQATENINEKNVGIYLYQEKNVFVISISNTYEGKMDLYKMSDRGYTTKSEGHGYGLSLVKEIVEKNHSFQNDMSICGNVFTQKIKLKLDDSNKK